MVPGQCYRAERGRFNVRPARVRHSFLGDRNGFVRGARYSIQTTLTGTAIPFYYCYPIIVPSSFPVAPALRGLLRKNKKPSVPLGFFRARSTPTRARLPSAPASPVF